MHSPLDTRQLRAFATLAETGSFTRAAEQLNLSQSAVSHSIKALEEDVGCLLLDRVGKKAYPNQAGEQLSQSAQRILNEMARARQDLTRLGQWGYGRLRVGAGATVCQYILPAVLREFRESFPKCVISIAPGDAPQLENMLQQNKIDLAVGLEPPHLENLEFRPLFSDELCFITNALHPWAQEGKVDRKSVPQEQYILYSKTSYTFQLIQTYFQRERVSLPSAIELGSIEAIKELVKIGLGISILTPWVLESELQEGTLVALPLGKRKLKRRWGILHRRERRLSLPEETFVGLCDSVRGHFQTPVT